MSVIIAKFLDYIEKMDFGNHFMEIWQEPRVFLEDLGADKETRDFLVHVYDTMVHDKDNDTNELQKFFDSVK